MLHWIYLVLDRTFCQRLFFTEGNIEENNSTIILANGMTVNELNKEKSKTIDKAAMRDHLCDCFSDNMCCFRVIN
jgi:hypothetical protein